MNEWEAISLASRILKRENDDCAVIDWSPSEKAVISTDMLHRKTDLPEGMYPRTIGWRSMAITLSDIGAMGARPVALVLAFAPEEFEEDFITQVVKGAKDVCELCGTEYAGGDFDRHDELTLVSTGVGKAENPVRRSGAEVGDRVCVTGELGRTAVGLRLFDDGEDERANELFRFTPRTDEGMKLGEHANAMMDISDGLAVSLHQLSESSGVGFETESSELPVMDEVEELDEAVFVGEDYELVFTLPSEELDEAREEVDFSIIGEVVDSGVKIDGEKLEKRGYQH